MAEARAPASTALVPMDDPVAGLIDIPLPAPVSLWPQTWELRLAIAVATAVIVAAIWSLLRRWFANRYRRAALAELDTIVSRPAPGDLLNALAMLVRRTALAIFPRARIAALDGDAWLAFLDASYNGTGFSSGPGRALGMPAYSPGSCRPKNWARWPTSSRVGSAPTMFELAWPWALLALPLPLLMWWLAPPYRAQEESIQVPFFGKLAEATQQTPEPGAVVRRRLAIQFVVASIAWVLIVIALARPQWVGDAVTRAVAARDLILAVDISGSMEQSDFPRKDGPPLKRLEAVKAIVGDFIARRHGDRVALIVFGTKAYLQVPFTQDLQTARMLLDQTEVGMAGQQTAIGDSIGLAIKVFEASKAQQKLVLLLTDGNDTASRVPPAQAADVARGKGIVVYTVGVGDPAAAGENRVDLAALRDIASTTSGQFFRAEDAEELTAIYAEIDKLVPIKVATQSWRPKAPLFQWPLGAAVLLTLSLWLILTARGALRQWSLRRHA